MPKKVNEDRLKTKFLKTFEKTNFNISETCRQLKVSRNKFYKWLKLDDDFRERYETLKEVYIDLAESQLIKLVQKGDFKAIRYLLDNLGKKRGYNQPQEVKHEISGNGSIDIKIVKVESDDKED